MSDDAMYRAQGDRTGGVSAMPQPFGAGMIFLILSHPVYKT